MKSEPQATSAEQDEQSDGAQSENAGALHQPGQADERAAIKESIKETDAPKDTGIIAGEAQIPFGAVPGDTRQDQKVARKQQRAATGRDAFLVGAGIFLSRIIGLVRQRVFAHYFGNTDAADAFNAAFRIPNFLQNVFGEGALSASFIPIYSGLLARDQNQKEADHVASAVFSFLALITSVIVLIGVLIAPYLIFWIAPGFTGPKRDLTIHLVRIFFPGAGLLVLSAWCLGILNSHRRFFLSYTAPVIWNLTLIAALIFYGRRLELFPLAAVTAWGSVIGSALQFLVQVPTVLMLARHLRPTLDVASKHVRTVMINFLPVFFSRGVVQISAYVDNWLASWLGTGAVSALGYTQSLYTLPVSLFGMSVSAAELPAMSSEHGSEEEINERLRTRLDSGLRQIAFFIVPSSMAFLALGDVITAVLYQTGRFTQSDSRYVWAILAGSTVGLLASTLGRLYSSTYYALHDTRTPLRYAIIRVFLTTVLGYLCSIPLPPLLGIEQRWGAAGLTASAGIAGWVEFLLLRRTLNRRIGKTGLPFSYAVKLWTSALVGALCGWGLKLALGYRHPFIIAVIVLSAYGFTYFGVTYAFGLPEMRNLIGQFTRRLKALKE